MSSIFTLPLLNLFFASSKFASLPLLHLFQARICLALWGAQFPLDAKGNPVATPQPAEGPVGDAVVANLANNISPQRYVYFQ